MLKILIADSSYLVKKGIIEIINQFQEVTNIKVIGTQHGLNDLIQSFSPDVLIINSQFNFSQNKNVPIKTLYIHHNEVDSNNKNSFSILDSKVEIIEKLTPYIKTSEVSSELDDSEELTPREKLILKNVALGLTNKEIANNLHISTHTVISHRKNITRKLNIKSVSGLTVYAILNEIINLEDIS